MESTGSRQRENIPLESRRRATVIEGNKQERMEGIKVTSNIAFVGDSLIKGLVLTKGIRDKIRARADEVRVHSGGTAREILARKDKWEIWGAGLVVLAVGSNDIANRCVAQTGGADEMWQKQKNHTEIRSLVDLVVGEAIKMMNENRDVMIVTPPPRLTQEKSTAYRIAEEEMASAAEREGFEVIRWGKLISESMKDEREIYRPDKVHMAEGGSWLLWNEIERRLTRRGYDMDRLPLRRQMLPMGQCTRCAQEGHSRMNCKTVLKVCWRCGWENDHSEAACLFNWDLCEKCGKYGHARSMCRGWRNT